MMAPSAVENRRPHFRFQFAQCHADGWLCARHAISRLLDSAFLYCRDQHFELH
jgi:hypothetical protein